MSGSGSLATASSHPAAASGQIDPSALESQCRSFLVHSLGHPPATPMPPARKNSSTSVPSLEKSTLPAHLVLQVSGHCVYLPPT